MRTLLLVSLVLFGLHLGCKAPSQELESPNIFQVLELTVAEQKSAIQIAEQAIEQRGLRTTGPLYHVGIQILRDKGGETESVPSLVGGKRRFVRPTR